MRLAHLFPFKTFLMYLLTSPPAHTKHPGLLHLAWVLPAFLPFPQASGKGRVGGEKQEPFLCWLATGLCSMPLALALVYFPCVSPRVLPQNPVMTWVLKFASTVVNQVGFFVIARAGIKNLRDVYICKDNTKEKKQRAKQWTVKKKKKKPDVTAVRSFLWLS